MFAVSVLFIGNSFVAQEDLPALTATALEPLVAGEVRVDSLVRAAGRWTQVEKAVGSGGVWRDTLVKGGWDWVILQEQSQIPGFLGGNPEWDSSLRALKKIEGRIIPTGAKTGLMMTWGYRDGDPKNAEIYPDFESMEARLEEGYGIYATAIGARSRQPTMIPVGPAYKRVYMDAFSAGRDPLDPEGVFAALYRADGQHPSLAGAWLSACVTAAALTGERPAAVSPPAKLGPTVAAYLQDVAARVVLDAPMTVTQPATPDLPAPPVADRTPEAAVPETIAAEPDGGICGGLGLLGLLLPVGSIARAAGRRASRRRRDDGTRAG